MVTGQESEAQEPARRVGSGASARIALAVGWVILVAVIDIAVGDAAALISLLVGAPLIAATAAPPRPTALVAALAVLVAVLLGFPNEFFGQVDHLTRVAGVIVGGALSVWVASLRQDREEDSVRLGVQYAVARTLSDAETVEQAAEPLLEAVGRPLGWEVGALWLIDGERMECVETWAAEPGDLAGFSAVTREMDLRRDEGLPGQVASAGRPVWFPDVLLEPGFKRLDAAREAGLHSAAGFPIRAGDEVVGVVELLSRETREPDRRMVELMAALTSQLAEYTERLRAASALRASEARKTAILDSALDCVISMDARGRVIEFNPAAERTFGYREEEAVGREMAELIIPPAYRERHRDGLHRFLETGEARILGRRIELTARRRDGSEFPVELTVHHPTANGPAEFTGTVRDISDRRAAEEEREELLRLEREARLDATRARDQLEAILGGVADAVTVQAPEEGIVFANQAAAEALGFQSVPALLSAPMAEVMAKFEMYTEDGEPFPLERLPGRLALQGNQAEAVVRFFVRATGEERWSVVKATPLKDEDGRVAMAINVIEDITAHKRAEREQNFLSESSRILSASLDPDETLRQIAQLAVPRIADWCAVDLRSDVGPPERVALAHADPEQVQRGRELGERYPSDPHAEQGLPQVLRTGVSEIYPEIPDEMLRAGAHDEEHLEILRDIGMRSAMIVAMPGRDGPIGAMTFVSGESGRRFEDTDLALAEELARRCATALENARLYADRAYIAKTLQESLLPAELPAIPGLETAARFRASGDGNEVGGDFYDLFETGGRGWTVVVGDVCGKGPDAAAVTALARYTLRAAAMRERLPSRSLRVLNEALLRQRQDRRFCTVAYAYFEQNGDGRTRVGFASGGHPLPVVLRADGTAEWFGAHGTLLGVVPDPDLEDRTTELAPGDALVFYTDGVTEAKGPDGMLGEDAVLEVVASAAGLDADSIAGKVEEAALEKQEGAPRDDIAVVVLRVEGGM